MKKLVLLSVLFCLSACTNKSPNQVLNLAIWGDYLNPQVQEQFEKETGIKVSISNYSSNEELLAKVQSNNAAWDVAVPSDYMVAVMIKLGILESLDKNLIPNSTQVLADFMDQEFDRGNVHSLPYAWSTVGIAYNTKLIEKAPQSWKDLLAPEYKGKISLLDDVRESMALALKIQNLNPNTTKEDEIRKGQELLLSFKPQVKMFRSDTIEALTNREIAAGHVYSTSGIAAEMKSQGEVRFLLAEEGGTKAIDNLVIFKNARNKEAAHKFINFLLTKEANAKFVETICGGPVIQGVRELLPDRLKNHSALFPDANTLKKYDYLIDLGPSLRLYDEAWTQVKAN